MGNTQSIVVTGAGRGLGRAIVRRLAASGHRVLGVDMRADGLASLQQELPDVNTLLADLTDDDTPRRVLDLLGSEIDVLVNNAGILDGLQLVDEVEISRFDEVLAVNLRAPFRLMNAVIPVMVERGGGVIVNVASAAGLTGGRAGAAYTASKWGLVGLTKNVASSHGQYGIRCNAVCPGAMDTEMNHTTFSERGLAMVMRGQGAPPVDPDLVASAVVFLIGPDASHLNGAALPVDGGGNAF